MSKTVFIPETPGGTLCDWLRADTEGEAWSNLLKDAAHMPYHGRAGFQARGYRVEEYELEEGAPDDE